MGRAYWQSGTRGRLPGMLRRTHRGLQSEQPAFEAPAEGEVPGAGKLVQAREEPAQRSWQSCTALGTVSRSLSSTFTRVDATPGIPWGRPASVPRRGQRRPAPWRAPVGRAKARNRQGQRQ